MADDLAAWEFDSWSHMEMAKEILMLRRKLNHEYGGATLADFLSAIEVGDTRRCTRYAKQWHHALLERVSPTHWVEK